MKLKQTKNAADGASSIVGSVERRVRHQEDRELVRLSQAGNDFAFGRLVQKHQRHVFDLVSGILRRTRDVEDVAQQVFLKTYRGIQGFDQRAAFSTWLYRIAVNQCRDHLRKQKAQPLVYEADLSEEQISRLDGIASSPRRDSGPTERMFAKEALHQISGSLSDGDRQLLILREIEGFSIRELSEILNLRANNVKIRLFRARGRVADACRRWAGQAARTKSVSTTRTSQAISSSAYAPQKMYGGRQTSAPCGDAQKSATGSQAVKLKVGGTDYQCPRANL